jgi:RNA-directed DNA polymerase
MKRVNNLYAKIYDMDNLILADQKARKGKKLSIGVRIHDKNRDENLVRLQELLKNKMYKTSTYDIYEAECNGKIRTIYRLPYYPDRICHHAIMNVMEPIWTSLFTRDTYSCIKGRGIHGAVRKLKQDMKDVGGTRYCLKCDIKKYYPSIDHGTLKSILRKKIKDEDLLWLLDEIIDSATGVPIGNYLSQFFANLYLAYFDHWVKEELNIQYYYRYCDDIVILHHDKNFLHDLKNRITSYLESELNLQVKENHQVFPVASRGVDFLGYVFFHTHIMLRKSIKKRFAKKAKDCVGISDQSFYAAYKGWIDHCNGRNLMKKLSA